MPRAFPTAPVLIAAVLLLQGCDPNPTAPTAPSKSTDTSGGVGSPAATAKKNQAGGVTARPID